MRPPSIALQWGHLRERISCKRPALVATTFSNSRGGRLRELRLYANITVYKPSLTSH